jgi:hypothetical protein
MRMLDWVHSNTSNSWPVVSLSLLLVPGSVSFQQWLLGSLTASDNTDHSTASTLNGLTDTGRETDTGLGTIFGVTDDDGRGT